MRYLLDTHIILWALINDSHINDDVKSIILNQNNEIYYSCVSTWEIEIKHLKNENFKLSASQFSYLCDQNGLLNLNIKNEDIISLEKLKKASDVKHNDPFDKLLLAQAINENMILITHDKKFNYYNNPNIMIV